MKIVFTFLTIIFSTATFADSFICLTKNFENKETFILINKIDNYTYNFIQTFDLNSNDFNEVPMEILQNTKDYLTLAQAANEMSITFHLDKKENYFEISHITLFVERELEKVKGVCQLN
tara:strand:+ start:1613 stop:1969 length:357 start_codon:yes stop_codon:yes gene_type:complete